jgi:hypothetical protein
MMMQFLAGEEEADKTAIFFPLILSISCPKIRAAI